MKALSDEELLQQYRQAAGKPESAAYVEELFGRYNSKVALWCYRIAGDQDRAADLAQDVMAKAWTHLDHFEGKSKFSTWLYSIARNHCFNYSKSAARRREDGLEPERLEAFEDKSAGPEQAAAAAEQMASARQIMTSVLTAVERQVMTLHYAEELPLDVVSRILRLENASGAKAFVVSAKRKLRDSVEYLAGRKRGGSGYEGGSSDGG